MLQGWMWDLCSSSPDSVFLLSHLRGSGFALFPGLQQIWVSFWCVILAPELLFGIASDDSL